MTVLEVVPPCGLNTVYGWACCFVTSATYEEPHGPAGQALLFLMPHCIHAVLPILLHSSHVQIKITGLLLHQCLAMLMFEIVSADIPSSKSADRVCSLR